MENKNDTKLQRESLSNILDTDEERWEMRLRAYERAEGKIKIKKHLRRGEIYEFDWGLNVSSEFSKRHYGVVLVDSPESNPLVTVCPLKTNMKGAHPKSDVNIGKINEINSEYETLAVVNQIRALDKLRIYRVQNIKSKQTGIVQSKLNMKLTDQQLEKLIKAIANYLNSNGGDL